MPVCFDPVGKSVWRAHNGYCRVASANAALISATSFEVGAFALDLNSKDAAVLVTFALGTCSAHVSGATGTAGIALVEIFEVP